MEQTNNRGSGSPTDSRPRPFTITQNGSKVKAESLRKPSKRGGIPSNRATRRLGYHGGMGFPESQGHAVRHWSHGKTGPRGSLCFGGTGYYPIISSGGISVSGLRMGELWRRRKVSPPFIPGAWCALVIPFRDEAIPRPSGPIEAQDFHGSLSLA